MLFATGDAGDQVVATGRVQADFPTTDPWVTAVGGTALGDRRRRGAPVRDRVADGILAARERRLHAGAAGHFNGGGGGGGSRRSSRSRPTRPSVVPAPIATVLGGAPGRTTPDVALDADPQTGMLVGETQTFADGTVRYGEFRLGGTSLASPLMAGVVALADPGDRRSARLPEPEPRTASRGRTPSRTSSAATSATSSASTT